MAEKDRWRAFWRSEKPNAEGIGSIRQRTSTRVARVALTSGVAATVVLGAGVASASIPGPNGEISGCYSAHGGRLRVIDVQAGARCRHHENQLTWNQTGRRGLRGPQGPPGESHLYIAGFSNVAVSASPTDVAVLEHVPAGTYLVSVTGQATPDQSQQSYIPQLTCSLTPSTTSYAPDSLPIGNPVIGAGPVSIGAEGDSVLTTGGTITFSCQAADLEPPPSYPTLQGVITAIPVEGTN